MAYLGSWKIDDYICFYANTHNASTGAATDADGVPTYRVYEDEAATPLLTGSMALIDSTNTAGFYSEQIQLTTASGFEKGKSYCVYVTATVSSVAGTMHHNFQMEAEVDANTVSPTVVAANVTQWLGQAAAAVTNNGVPEVDITHIGGVAVSTSTAQLGVNVVNAAGTAWGSGAITAASIATGAIANTKFAAGAIDAAAIATGAIDADALAADTLTAAKVAADVSTEIATTILGTAVPGAFGAGTLGRVIGRSCPDVAAGGANGLFIAGTNAATTITSALTTTFAGNLTGNVGGSTASVVGLTASNLDTTISSRLAPTIAGRTLDVSTGGEAGIDWANVGTPDSTVGLSATTVGTATNVTNVNGIANNAITANAINADAFTAAKFASDVSTEIAAAVAAFAGSDPSGVIAVNAGLMAKIDWIAAWCRNKQTMNRSTGVVNLRNDADNATIGTFTGSDDGTTFTRPEVT